MQRPTLSKSQIDLAHMDAMERLTAVAQSNLLAFTKYTMSEFRINWHHRVISSYLDKFLKWEITRLLIFLPPQVGKTELISRRLPAFIFGHDPTHQIIASSYSHNYAQTINRDVQRIIDSEKYYDIFPNTGLAGPGSDAEGTWARNNNLFEIVGHGGRYHCSGFEGSLTGKTANTFIIDDPVKNWKDASSITFRNAQWDWLLSTAMTRFRPTKSGNPPRMIITMTRWNFDDIAGRLMKAMRESPNAEQWTVLNLPAIKEDEDPQDPRKMGEALWPEVFPLENLLRFKQNSPRIFNSLYQQKPAPDSGTIVQRSWWKYYTSLPPLESFEKMIQSWDLTFTETKDGSYVVGQVWGRIGANKYLIDQMRARAGFNEQVSMIAGLSAKWPNATAKYIEKAANGHATANYLQNKISGIILVPAKGSKEDRARAASPQIQAGNVYLPDPSIAPWISDFVEEWAIFPDPGSPNDQVDAASQGLVKLEEASIMDISPISLTGASKWGRI